MDKVTEMRSVLSMCLVETERTVKEVWSWAKKAFKSDLFTRLISERSFNNFLGVFRGDLKQGVVFPLNKILKCFLVIVKIIIYKTYGKHKKYINSWSHW